MTTAVLFFVFLCDFRETNYKGYRKTTHSVSAYVFYIQTKLQYLACVRVCVSSYPFFHEFFRTKAVSGGSKKREVWGFFQLVCGVKTFTERRGEFERLRIRKEKGKSLKSVVCLKKEELFLHFVS